MSEHREFSEILFVGLLFLPASVSLFFAWSVWIANKRPAISTWRLNTFRWGLISALVATVIFAFTCAHMFISLENSRGVWLIANWVGTIFWVAGLAGASTGRGWGKVTLFLWGILMFAGVFGVSSAMIP
jgi:hypothetical protein